MNFGGGRSGSELVGISVALEKQGFEIGRLKTGTPPRIDGRMVDYNALEIQYEMMNHSLFLFNGHGKPTKQGTADMLDWIY